MDDSLYRTLKLTAVAIVVAWLGWTIYDSFIRQGSPGDRAYHTGNTLFEDGAYDRALSGYETALAANPEHVYALRGYARTLMQLDRFDEALVAFDQAIAREPQFGGTYANRGILRDRMGHYELAIKDYERALELDPTTSKGPNWLTRFLRVQPDKPPGIAERAAYLREELAKPEGERLLRIPEIDAAQRSYKQ